MLGNYFQGRRKRILIPIVFIGLAFLPLTILLIVGFLINSKVENKKLRTIGLSIVCLLILFFGSTYFTAFNNSKQSQTAEQAAVQSNNPTISAEISSPTPAETINLEEAKVKRVVDGDTIELENGQKVRYIGIDTPETTDCYFTEATNRNKQLVEGKTVRLEKDVSETDRYGRLLRYVYIEGTFVNEILVQEGFAHSSTYPPDIKYQDKFLAAERVARDNKQGLWAACTTPVANPSPVAKPQSSQAVQGAQTSGGVCKYYCSGPDRDCSDFSTHSEAQSFFNCCGFSAEYDPMRLDRSKGVGNGIACESLP